ncbi:peptidase M61 [Paraferrimonas sedimenticola]|uniref:Peptidase M61 n=2 Tax=Paraferrimonas sedimenticola TaxID=375674 RepID=A0AA37RT97_9GAMM|nr:PDZ domain-containing protein [Paraferrimonas sedimenticola]GLP95221.1 peptidase M61 [Paraferrimonas sedimenticola]
MSFQSSAEVHYQIDLTQGTQQLARVSASFPETPAGQLTLNIPSWRTGKYTIMPVAEGIRRVSITDEQGQPLSWDRSASGEWVVNLPKATKVKVSYQLHADELGVRLRHIDDSHAFLDASGVFVYSPSYRDDSVRVQLQVPKGWQSHSGMDSGDTPHSFVAPNYDVLIDSPIETGVSQSYQWKLDGRDYELVIWGEGNYNAEQMVEDLKKLSPTATAIWDDYPYKRYVYMVHATSGARGATEHLNSTIIQRPRFRFGSREDYLAFISTASHEFIHTWNVKAYRPEALVPYDYQNEAISDLLWISEGSTSYFQRQLLLRGDIISFDEFSKDLARRIDAHLNTPGRQVQSVAEASRGQWIRRHDHFAHNHSVNIYSEGYLASLLLDFDMLKTSNLKRSYRDLHRVLYRDYSTPKSFNRNDVLKILSELQGRDYSNWWQAHIESPMQPDFFELMALAGLSLNYPRGTKDVVSADLTLKAGDRAVVDKVDREGVAWKAGLTHGDEIVAINGLKVAGGDWSKRLQDFKAGDQLTLSYFRRDRLQETQIILSSKKDKPLTLTMMDKPSKQQKAFFKAWLGLSWEEAIASNKKVFW